MTERLRIATARPDEIKDGYAHGQWVFDSPGLVMNFYCDVTDNIPDVEPMIRRMREFLASDEPYMAFESPHTPGINFLHREAAQHIIATQGAWSRKLYARTDPHGNVELVDAESGEVIKRMLGPDGRRVQEQAGVPLLRKQSK